MDSFKIIAIDEGKLSEQATLKDIDEPLVNLDDTNNAEEPDEKPKKSDFVWQDDDDDTNKQQSAREKFAELSGGWLKLKKVEADEDPFGGKIFQDDTRILPEKEIDIEECGTIGIRGGGKIGAYQFSSSLSLFFPTFGRALRMKTEENDQKPAKYAEIEERK